MDGLILVHKPEGPTSHDIVVRLRRTLGIRRIGHFGTLDPFASGLLLAGVGKATRLFPFFSASDKTYRGRIRLGIATDTYDRTGTVLSRMSPSSWPPVEDVRRAIDGLTGEILQSPPPFSAKKILGRPSYAYARRRLEVEPQPCRVKVHAFLLKNYNPPDVDFEVACSAGTYIRSMARDLGTALGCGAHLADLVRTAVGPYRLEEALSLETLAGLAEEGRGGEALIPLDRLLPHLPRVVLSSEDLLRVKNGRPLAALPGSLVLLEAGRPPSNEPPAVRLIGPEGNLVALARFGPGESSLFPFLVLL